MKRNYKRNWNKRIFLFQILIKKKTKMFIYIYIAFREATQIHTFIRQLCAGLRTAGGISQLLWMSIETNTNENAGIVLYTFQAPLAPVMFLGKGKKKGYLIISIAQEPPITVLIIYGKQLCYDNMFAKSNRVWFREIFVIPLVVHW